MSDNLNVSVRQIKSLPGGPLVQPLIRHLDARVGSPLIVLGKIFTILSQDIVLIKTTKLAVIRINLVNPHQNNIPRRNFPLI